MLALKGTRSTCHSASASAPSPAMAARALATSSATAPFWAAMPLQAGGWARQLGVGSTSRQRHDLEAAGGLAVLALARQGLFLLEDAQEGPQAVGRRGLASRICTDGMPQRGLAVW